jgi:uncharacterized membrane protein YciS (DUF1049 family)
VIQYNYVQTEGNNQIVTILIAVVGILTFLIIALAIAGVYFYRRSQQQNKIRQLSKPAARALPRQKVRDQIVDQEIAGPVQAPVEVVPSSNGIQNLDKINEEGKQVTDFYGTRAQLNSSPDQSPGVREDGFGNSMKNLIDLRSFK